MKINAEILLLRMEEHMAQGKGSGPGCKCGCRGPGSKHHGNPDHVCVCSACGRLVTLNPGDPCRMGKCPHCGGDIVRQA